jgi:hypothetical protein
LCIVILTVEGGVDMIEKMAMGLVDQYIYKYDVNKLRCYTKAERETKVKNRKGREWI